MDGADLAALVKAGGQLFSLKLFVTSMYCLWVYDYLLTLGDEIKYAWTGRRSWMFALFLANRYTPLLSLVWGNTIVFNYTKPFCQHTKWLIVFHTTAVTVLSEMAIMTRIWVITEKNRLLCTVLFALIAVQLCFGVFSVVRAAMHQVFPVPDIDLDAFKVCSFGEWRFGEVFFINIALAFDVLAFVVIFFTARRLGTGRYPGVPSILDTLLRDATIYFVLVLLCQLLFQVFTLAATDVYKVFPGAASMAIIPIMASRLMISLKKAGSEHIGLRSLPTIHLDPISSTSNEGARFAPQVLGESHGVSETSPAQNQEDMELESALRWARDRRSLQLHLYTPNRSLPNVVPLGAEDLP